MQTDNNTLIDELLALTESSTAAARRFKTLSEEQLNFKETPERWSILECLEHLNRYGEFYLPAIENALRSDKGHHGKPVYKSGSIGNWFANLMKVKNGRIVKMKTPSDKNPSGSNLTSATIDRFLEQQEILTRLLNQARNANLTKTKVPISLAKFIKLRLGDTFRFFINHIERHIIQADNNLKSQGLS